MDIRQMQYLITLADTGSYTQAARELNISQPSLSTFVTKVESELELQLFDRNTTPITLTYAGRIYIDSLRSICTKAELLDRRMNDVSGREAGTIRVGFPTERAAYMIPYVMPVMKKQHPDIDVRITTGSSERLMQMVDGGKLDMAVLPASSLRDDTGSMPEGLVRNELYEEEVFLVDGCGYIKEEHLIPSMKNCADPMKLDGIPLVTLDKTHGIRHFQDNLFRLHEAAPDIVMEVPSNAAAYRLASAGLGAAIVPGMVVEMFKPISDVRTYHISVTGYRWKISAITKKNAYITGIEKAFINCVRSVMNVR
jgi:DNA-binding transcriptional LysR family regulator